MPALDQLLSTRLARKIAAAQVGNRVVAAVEFIVPLKEPTFLKFLHSTAHRIGSFVSRLAYDVDVVVDLFRRPDHWSIVRGPDAVYELENSIVEFIHARDPWAHIPNEWGLSLSRFGDNSNWSIALIRGMLNPLMEYIIQNYKVLWGIHEYRPCEGQPQWVQTKNIGPQP